MYIPKSDRGKGYSFEILFLGILVSILSFWCIPSEHRFHLGSCFTSLLPFLKFGRRKLTIHLLLEVGKHP